MKECNSIQEFNEEFFKGKNISWFNNIGLLKLNDYLVAEVRLLNLNQYGKFHHGIYVGYTVTIKDYDIRLEEEHFYFDMFFYIPEEIETWKIVTECQYGFFMMDPEDKEIEKMVNKIFEFINNHK